MGKHCELLKIAGIENYRPQPTPMVSTTKLVAEGGELLEDPSFYQSIVGKLQYLCSTRPDITFAVINVSQYLSHPRKVSLGCC